MKRSSVEVDPTVLLSIKLLAVRRGVKVKDVADTFLRYCLRHAKLFFPDKHKRNPDNGK